MLESLKYIRNDVIQLSNKKHGFSFTYINISIKLNILA